MDITIELSWAYSRVRTNGKVERERIKPELKLKIFSLFELGVHLIGPIIYLSKSSRATYVSGLSFPKIF